MKKFLDILSLIITILVILFLIWVAASYFEIVSQNLDLTSIKLSDNNFFIWFTEIVS